VRRAAPILLLALALAAPSRAASRPWALVATIEPLAMIARALAGEGVAVSVLVPPGASPHTFEPRPGDVAALSRAHLLVAVGGGLDDWAVRLVGAAGGSAAVLRVLDLPGLDPLAAAPGSRHRRDPHVWLDPIRVRDVIVPALAVRLGELDPGARSRYASRAAAFQDRLTTLDGEIRAQLAGHGREYVAYHGAWRYFASRYGLEEVGVVEEAPGEEPTPGALGALVAAARRARVPAILVEPQLDPRVAETLAREWGGTVVLADALGDPRVPTRADYVSLLRFDAAAFARALGGAP
jgi:ABC-type Zn uptake system ZnuABC Zn-binding protein ZnuA